MFYLAHVKFKKVIDIPLKEGVTNTTFPFGNSATLTSSVK